MRRRYSLGIIALTTFAWGAMIARADPATPYDGLKHTVAVYQFQTPDTQGLSSTADGLTALLTDALVRDGRFVVVEREDLANVETEQQLGTQGAATHETAAAAGKLIGASLIIRGAVTKYDPNASASSFSIGMGFGSSGQGGTFGSKSGDAVIAIAIRVIDSTTGQVLATVKTEGKASTHESDFSLSGANVPALSSTNISATPFGRAAEDAIDKAVPRIALAANQQPWTAEVIEVDGDTVYVNAGAEQNLHEGTQLHVRRKSKDLTDPATGVVLDTLMSDIGDIRVQSVRPKVSTAVVVNGGAPARGDLLLVKAVQ